VDTQSTFQHSSSTQGTEISAVKSVKYEAVQTATNCTLQSLHLGNMQYPCFSFPFHGGGTYDKVTNALRFLVLDLVLHLNVLNVLAKQNT
jgi:hypothetical protein